MDFNPFIRRQYYTWNITQLGVLLSNAKAMKSSSYVSYAALEARMAFERVEYELLRIAAQDEPTDEFNKRVDSFKGLSRTNQKYGVLKYRYQTFSEVFASEIGQIKLKAFDFSRVEKLENRLAGYIHIYTRNDNDFIYESSFIQQGISLLNEVISFWKEILIEVDGKHTFAIICRESLKNGAEQVFDEWLRMKDDNIEILRGKIKELIRNSNTNDKLYIEERII